MVTQSVQKLTSADEEEEFIIASMKADVDVVDIMGNRKSPTWLVQHSNGAYILEALLSEPALVVVFVSIVEPCSCMCARTSNVRWTKLLQIFFIVSYRLGLPSAASEVIAVDANPSSSQSPQAGESVPQLWQQQPPML